ITYLLTNERLKFFYLYAIIDRVSRKVVAWIRVVDKTTQQVLYSKGFSVPTCDAAIYASDGASSPNYLPVGTVWSVGVYEQQRAFMEQSLFETRDAPAYIRLNADWSPIRVSWR
ncbi:MAG TPA: hypothetical protein GXZ82_09605, partial [Firmicutes bacterium]|nr:hypothetical protein [Bacillota bacterium]